MLTCVILQFFPCYEVPGRSLLLFRNVFSWIENVPVTELTQIWIKLSLQKVTDFSASSMPGDAASLEVFKVRLDRAWSNLL